MHKLKTFLVGLAVCCMCAPAFAEEKVNIGTETLPKYNFTYEMGKNMPTDVFAGEITAKEMEERLKDGLPNFELYLKYDEDKVLVFNYLAKDRASCRQIIYAAPADQMLEVYTNDKKTFNQFWNTIRPYNSEWNLVDGYQVVADKSPAIEIGPKRYLYRIWFKKVKPDNRTRIVRGGTYCAPYPYYYPWSWWNTEIVIGHRHYGHYGPPRPHYRPGPRPGLRPHPGGRPHPGPRR